MSNGSFDFASELSSKIVSSLLCAILFSEFNESKSFKLKSSEVDKVSTAESETFNS